MYTPINRKMFERHIYLLAERMRNGRLVLTPDCQVAASLINVRMTPNKRVDFCTVNESARLLANSTAHYSSPEFMKDHDAKK